MTELCVDPNPTTKASVYLLQSKVSPRLILASFSTTFSSFQFHKVAMKYYIGEDHLQGLVAFIMNKVI